MQIIVIGAGVIGASIAHTLSRRGARVTVLEMRAPGRGASWASAGLLAPYTEAHGESPLLHMGARSLTMFDAFVAAAREGSGAEIEYARTGTFEVSLTDDDTTRLRASQTWLESAGVANGHQWIEGAAAREFEPALSPRVQGGLFIREHGFVGVQSLVSALIQSARRARAVVEAPVEAVDVTAARDGVGVRTNHKHYAADHVVVAAGTWSGNVRIAGMAAVPVHPVRGQLLRLKSMAAPMPRRPVWTSDCYTVPWSDGTVLVGATVENVGFDENTTAAGIHALTAAAMDVLPGTASAMLLDARAGLRPATTDGLPIIGVSDAAPRVMFATGHYRNGVLLAPLTAAMVEAAILDGRTDAMMAWTSPNRHP